MKLAFGSHCNQYIHKRLTKFNFVPLLFFERRQLLFRSNFESARLYFTFHPFFNMAQESILVNIKNGLERSHYSNLSRFHNFLRFCRIRYQVLHSLNQFLNLDLELFLQRFLWKKGI